MKISRVLGAVVVASTVSGAALAADLPTGKAPPMLEQPPVFTWTGFYIGVNRGWGWANQNVSLIPGGPRSVADIIPQTLSANLSGGAFGAQLGYNWQFGRFVLGAEGDFAAASISGVASSVVPSLIVPLNGTTGFMTESRVNWLASLRARAGLATELPLLGPTLLYATGGIAWENFSTTSMANSNVAPAVFGQSSATAFKNTRTGYVVGAGAEWAFAPNWTARAEYLFYGFGGAANNASTFANCAIPGGCGYAISSGKNNIQLVRTGLNYKFGGPGGGMPWSAGPVASWTGLYAGGNGGWGWSSTNASLAPAGAFTNADLLPMSLGTSLNGMTSGIQAGFNWQISRLVLGAEGDVGFASLSGSRAGIAPSVLVPAFGTDSFQARERINWLASLRARAGVAIGPALLYATGGLAMENISTKVLVSSNTGAGVFGDSVAASFSNTRTGYAVGGGLEWMIAPNWSLRTEYLHYGFAKTSTNATSVFLVPGYCGIPGGCGVLVGTGGNRIDVVRTALNYRFNFGASAPVVAKY